MAVIIGCLVCAEALILAGAWVTLYNVARSPASTVTCTAHFAALPAPINTGCGYSRLEAGLYFFGVAVVLGLVVWSWRLAAKWMLRPLSATAGTVRRLGPHSLGQRIELMSGPDPYKELADAIDDALDRLSAGYESQRQFAANASHELRTPLAVQRVLTEVAMEAPDAGQDLKRLGTQLLRTNKQNEDLIEGLLVLAESDRGLQGKTSVRLDELAAEVIETHQELAAKYQVALRPKLNRTSVSCDPVLITRLIANLVSNGIKYNEPSGWVEIEVNGDPVIVVRNTGEPVPAEAVPTLFEPFKRLGGDRVRTEGGGVGLGLAIVRSIVLAHQGTIRALPRSGGGLNIEIALPSRGSRTRQVDLEGDSLPEVTPSPPPYLRFNRSGQASK